MSEDQVKGEAGGPEGQGGSAVPGGPEGRGGPEGQGGSAEQRGSAVPGAPEGHGGSAEQGAPKGRGDSAEQGGDSDDQAVADTLARERPVPPGQFRGALGRYLAARDPGYGPRPVHLRLVSAAYLAAGLVLLALGLLQATGSL